MVPSHSSGELTLTLPRMTQLRSTNSAPNSSRLMAGLILYTGLGWLVSRWVGHQALLMAIGAIVGLALSYYLMFASLAKETRDASRPGNHFCFKDLTADLLGAGLGILIFTTK
jgi:hypothetical protein